MIVESSSTLTAVVGTGSNVASPSTSKTRVMLVDISALAGTETVTLTISGAVLAAGAVQVIQSNTFSAGNAAPHIQSPPILMPQGGTFIITQNSGTARSFPWAICTLD